jgi:release factor glutamine methyltransferase
VKIADFLDKYSDYLKDLYDDSEAKSVVANLLGETFDFLPSQINQRLDFLIEDDKAIYLTHCMERLKKGEPLQYITGIAWFCDLPIPVSKNVLIPRPETEELVALIREEIQAENRNILDVCTGSGCIALALKNYFPKSTVNGCDVSFDALELARSSSSKLNLAVEWFWADVLEDQWDAVGIKKFDVIVSNPPYITNQEIGSMHKNVMNFEPHLALFAPDEDPLAFYRRIAWFAKERLVEGGSLWFECNKIYAKDVTRLLTGLGFVDVILQKDISENDRFVSGFWPF